jgi:hypothetical protein
MPLLNDDLSLWEISYRWSGYDPDSIRIGHPLSVKDNFRLMMEAILQGHLHCTTLSLEKRKSDSNAPPEFFIRHHIDDVYLCISGQQYNRKLLRHAHIERWAMRQWCQGQGIPLPEFWFPPGWNTYYEWQDPNADEHPKEAVPIDTNGGITSHTALDPDFPPAKRPVDPAPPTTAPMSENEAEGRRKLDQRQRRKIACQEVAIRVWFKNPEADVKVIANSPEVQDLAGGSESDFDVLLRWLGEVDPRDPGKRRGPKRKK